MDSHHRHSHSHNVRRKRKKLVLLLTVGLLSLLPSAYGLQISSSQGERRATRESSIRLEQEKHILLALKSTILASNPSKAGDAPLGGWDEGDPDPCGWKGITCSNTPEGVHVSAIDVSGGGYAGPLPLSAISNLTFVIAASFARNAFSGGIDPAAVSSLPSGLDALDLSFNLLVGPIPPALGGLASLASLDLSFNLLTGGVPDELFAGAACSSLRSLNFSSNEKLGGFLPAAAAASCSSIAALDASNCSLSGGYPAALAALPSLQALVLRGNHLAGQIPASAFASCSSLVTLDISFNNLTGDLPPQIGNCTQLKELAISNNAITSLPPTLASLLSLEQLIASHNLISRLPDELGACSKIKFLTADANALSGIFPTFISRLSSLEFLSLYSNAITGELPPWLGTLSSLRHFDASSNSLTGGIPLQITSLRKMQFLLLANNHLTGQIPNQVGNMESLQVLDLSSNLLHGFIPRSISKLQRLLWLMLANNNLSGPIPHEIGDCTSLLWLNAMNNSLSGYIPSSLASIGSEVDKTFGFNALTLPSISRPMGECSAVQRWIPSHYPPFDIISNVMTTERCRSFWNLLLRGVFMYPLCPSRPASQSMGYIQLSMNNLTGDIPHTLSSCSHLGLLFLDENQLSGEIPMGFAGALTGLNLSMNHLSGQVPAGLGSLTCLVSLDLSFNNLAGRIPGELQNLTQLNRFNISYNPNLVGPVPSGQQFSTFGTSVYEGNPRLCSTATGGNSTAAAASRAALPPCGGDAGGDGGAGRVRGGGDGGQATAGIAIATIVGISLACTLGLIVVVLLGFCLLGKAQPLSDAAALEFMMVGGKEHHRHFDHGTTSVQVSLFSVELPKHLTYTDLVTATSNFDEANVVGSGGFGVVYKAKLHDGSTVAIKKLIQEGPQADREFLAEMETLGHLHHENLVPLLGCSSCGTQKLLVYKFMEKGSLDDWLHERPGGREALEWPLRLDIALGIARGLKFLHHNCSPPVVHRDMKASNILLDDAFHPRLTDFGLARVLGGAQETHVSTVVAGTLGYVPPEYCQTWRATTKGDVYSFGVVLLELATGRRPMSGFEAGAVGTGGGGGGSLIEWVAHHLKKGVPAEVCDPVVTRGTAPPEILGFLRLAVCCTAELPVRRPTMREVLRILEEIKAGNYTGVMLTHQSSRGHG